MASSINASTTAGVVTTADTSGVLQLQTAGTTAISIDASQAVTVQGLTVGRGAGAVSTNTAVGASALAGSNSGTGDNVALGFEALKVNTTGSRNTAVGNTALKANTTGVGHVSVGHDSLSVNTTGSDSTAVGRSALSSNTTGSSNTGLGYFALAFNTTASNNTAVGYQAAYSNTTGFENSAGGRQALYSNTTGNYNTAFGHQAGYAIATTNQSTCVGSYAGLSTTGGLNSFFGYGAGNTITTGTNNTIIGSFDGNGDGLDIRTVSNYVVLADGSGNRQITMKEGQTLALDSAVPNAGTGITFPATQSASSNANTLDDYEEGSYTPTVDGFTVSGTTTLTGAYTKIGRMVFVSIKFANTGTIAYGTSCNISLPFAIPTGALPTGGIVMYVNNNSESFTSGKNGTQFVLDTEGGARFFPGSFTTTSAGQHLFFSGFYRTS